MDLRMLDRCPGQPGTGPPPNCSERPSGKPETAKALLAGLPGELGARVGALGRRSRPDTVRDVVLDLLHRRAWRLKELGQLLQRNPEYVRQKYVQPLLEAARIRMTRPDMPNDPEQAYRAVEEA